MWGRLWRCLQFVVVATVAASCGIEDTRAGARTDVVGHVASDGSSTVFPIAQAVAEDFQRTHNRVHVSVAVSGTGGGFQRFCNAEVDIANASRPMRASERAECAAAGVDPIELTVAWDGLSVVVNPENDFAACLTLAELRRIWQPESDVRLWSEVRAGFPAREIQRYGPGPTSGTFDHFTATVVGERGASTPRYQAANDDNVVVQGVWGDRYALGYIGFAYYAENRDKLRLVGIDSGEGCVRPSRETIAQGTYAPLSRELLVYVSRESLARSEVRTYMEFLLDHATRLVTETGYLPLAEQEYQLASARLAPSVTSAR